MSLLQRCIAPVARRMPAAMQKRTIMDMTNNPATEYGQYVHARDMLLGLAGSGLFVAYAAKVLAGEPAHEEAHPYYQAPYGFSKRKENVGAHWWPGRKCQFFEFNCFAATYKEADELLAEQKKK